MVGDVEAFLRDYVDALRDHNAAVFAGAGLSIPAGLVDWQSLLRDIAHDIGLDIGREQDLIAVAQYHVNERGGRHRINQALVTEFAERAGLTENHRILAALPIRTFWTTNYDTLLEDALRAAKKRPDVKITVQNLATTLPKRDAIVYKMHGDVSQPDRAVVTKDDYESYAVERQLFATALQGDLVAKTFLFIGFSFSDPNLSYILGRIRVLLGQSRRDHYCLLRRVARSDFADDGAYQYARARQDLQVRDLRRYGIIGILLDDYSEYTNLLRELARRYHLGQVFVSGSAATYAPWADNDGRELCGLLGRALINAGYHIVTGFGSGVGSYLLNGALDGLAREGSYALHDSVVLRPFPHGIADPELRETRWAEYRREMISHAGVALFLFGNRIGQNGELENARGVVREFEIARDLGLYVLPIGCTGYAAAELHDRVVKQFDEFFPNKPALRAPVEALGDLAEPRVVVQRIMSTLIQLR